MTIDEVVSRGFYSNTTEADIAQIPTVDAKGWTLLDQLTAFFEHYKREADAPIRYNGGVLTFAIPPRLSADVTKAVFMSATLDLDLFKRAFPEAHTENLPHTEFHPKVNIYQLRTNRNPRGTVYEFGERFKPDGTLVKVAVGLNETGETYWRMAIDEISDSPDPKHSIITYKQVLDWKRNEDASDLTELDNIIATAHYGNLVGLDTDFQDTDVLWVLFSPEIPHGNDLPKNEILWRAKMFFGDDETPLDYERDPETGQYRDKRIQKIWANAVIGEIIQGIGRGRAVRKPITIVLFISHFIPGITDRPETKLFDEADWQIAGGLDGLDEAIAQREEFEARAAALTAENTIEEWQEIYGCSERWARVLWERAGGREHKVDTDKVLLQRILEMNAQGGSIRKIASELNISRGKVEGVLKKHKVS